MPSDWNEQVIQPVEHLLRVWQERGDKLPLDGLLPVWRANNGLTDGWSEAVGALRAVASSCFLPGEERALLQDVADRIESAVRNR